MNGIKIAQPIPDCKHKFIYFSPIFRQFFIVFLYRHRARRIFPFEKNRPFFASFVTLFRFL